MTTKAPENKKWIQLQINVFTRWVQNQLKNDKNIHIENITKDLSNGVALVELAKTLTQKDTPRNWVMTPKRTVEMVQNCDLAIDMFVKDGVSLVGISGKDVNDNNEKLILGLIWSLILYYSIGKSIQNDENSKEKENAKTNLAKRKKNNEAKMLKSWAADRIKNYPNINNFSPYELSMCALLDSYVPSKINYYSLDPKNSDFNADLATKVMNDLEIPIYIYPDDVKDQSQIDDKTLLTQLASMKSVLEEQASKFVKRIENEKHESDSENEIVDNTNNITNKSIDNENQEQVDEFSTKLFEENEFDNESRIKADSVQTTNNSTVNDNHEQIDQFANKLFEEYEFDNESRIKTDSTHSMNHSNEKESQESIDEFSTKLFEENEFDNESKIKVDSTQTTNNSTVNDSQGQIDEFANKLFEENEFDNESRIKTDSVQSRNISNENDNQRSIDEFSTKLFEENEFDNESRIKADSVQTTNNSTRNGNQGQADEFANKLFEENEFDNESRIKTDSAQSRNILSDNDNQRSIDIFSNKIFEENEFDHESRIKSSSIQPMNLSNEINNQSTHDFDSKLYEENLYDNELRIKRDSIDQPPELITRTTPISKQLNDNFHESKSDLKIDYDEEKAKAVNNKYEKLQTDKTKLSFKDWFINKVYSPLKRLFNSKPSPSYPYGLILFSSPITPFAYYVDNYQ